MDIYMKLKADHRAVKKMMEDIEKCTSRSSKRREELFAQLKTELLAHSRVEEAVFYSVLKKEKGSVNNVLEALNEHHVVDLLMSELDTISKNNPHWKAKFTFLKEVIEHHVQEEESELFKKAHEIIGKEESINLGKAMEQREKSVKEALEPVA